METEGGSGPGRRGALRWVAGGAVLVLLAILLTALARPRGVEVQIAEARRGDLVVPVQCDGTLEPPPGGELRSPETAVVAEVLAREGERVTAGTPLVRLENAELSQKALDAHSEALRLNAEKAAAEADLAEGLREEKHRREVVEADERLLASGAIARATVETDERALKQAEDTTRSARTRLAGLEGSGSRLALAERAATELERRSASLTFKAPASGVVYGLPRRTGEAVSAGQVVASVVDPGSRRVRARVDQPDLPRVAAGQRLVISFDGLPRERWEGRVTSVSPGLFPYEGRDVGEVLGEVADPSGKLPTNAVVEVQIIAGEKSGALLVSRAAVLRDGDRRYLYVLEDGRAKRRDVQVGLSGLNEVEIVSGVAEKDRVILPGSASLSDGLRVKPGRAST
jgi:RND family efflux transporter MFP subunit